jgi:hypothetical protein
MPMPKPFGDAHEQTGKDARGFAARSFRVKKKSGGEVGASPPLGPLPVAGWGEQLN